MGEKRRTKRSVDNSLVARTRRDSGSVIWRARSQVLSATSPRRAGKRELAKNASPDRRRRNYSTCGRTRTVPNINAEADGHVGPDYGGRPCAADAMHAPPPARRPSPPPQPSSSSAANTSRAHKWFFCFFVFRRVCTYSFRSSVANDTCTAETDLSDGKTDDALCLQRISGCASLLRWK